MSPNNLSTSNEYGQGDATYRAAGGLEGITRLVDAFYERMDHLPEAKAVREMHPKDLTLSRKKLTFFLSGWMGGPKLYREHFGPISIPKAHSHLPIDANVINLSLTGLVCRYRSPHLASQQVVSADIGDRAEQVLGIA